MVNIFIPYIIFKNIHYYLYFQIYISDIFIVIFILYFLFFNIFFSLKLMSSEFDFRKRDSWLTITS